MGLAILEMGKEGTVECRASANCVECVEYSTAVI